MSESTHEQSKDAEQPLSEATRRELIAALNQNWQREVEGARTYRDLAAGEKERGRQNGLVKVAEAEERRGRRCEHGQKGGGGGLGDAIYGANDGLGAVFGIVSGVAGATGSASHIVLISGLAGMLASALSMGTGAYLATKSQREVYEAEIARER